MQLALFAAPAPVPAVPAGFVVRPVPDSASRSSWAAWTAGGSRVWSLGYDRPLWISRPAMLLGLAELAAGRARLLVVDGYDQVPDGTYLVPRPGSPRWNDLRTVRPDLAAVAEELWL